MITVCLPVLNYSRLHGHQIFLAIFLIFHSALTLSTLAAEVQKIAEAMYLQALLVIWVVVFAFVSMFIRIAQQRMGQPIKIIYRMCRMNRARFSEGAVFVVTLTLMMQVYMLLKVAIPRFVPFYADPILEDLDAMLFGQDPWRITHAFLGAEATRILDSFYVVPCVVVTVGMILWVCFSKDRSFSRRGVLSITMCCLVLGVWMALGLSSAGPIYVEHFYGSSRFAGLQEVLPPDLAAVRTQAYLLENFGTPGFGKGISAAPSMHNALYLLLIWIIHDRFGKGWKLWCAIAFETTVFLASVHLGWHYAMDGLIAAIAVPPIWYFAGYIDKFSLPSFNGGIFVTQTERAT